MTRFPVFDGAVRIRSSETADGVCVLRLDAPAQCVGALPGQFVLLRHASGPFLPRPLSIVSADNGLVLAANLWGPGTTAIAAAPAGDVVNLTGPLGNGFTNPAEALTLVGDLSHIGGVLAVAAARRRMDDTVIGVADTDRERRVLRRLFGNFGVEAKLATSGEVLAALGDAPARLAVSVSDPLAGEIQALAGAAGRPGEVLLHAMMACGVGACHACVHPMRGAPPVLVCDGPVFDLQAPEFAQHKARRAA